MAWSWRVAPIEGEWVDRVIGIEGSRAEIATLRTPDGHGRIELDKFHQPSAVAPEPEDAPVNTLGIRRMPAPVRDLKRARGREILMFGGHILWNDLLLAGLVDELRHDDRVRAPQRRGAARLMTLQRRAGLSGSPPRSPRMVMRAHRLDPHRADMPIETAEGIDEEPMSERSRPGGSPGTTMVYQIRLAGHLDPRWAAWFDGLAVTAQADGSTVIAGHIRDQAALHGILQRVRDLGLTLVSVTQPEADAARGR